LRGEVAGIRVYDDFAHHPTAIAATIDALRGSRAGGRIIALVEPRSNTMVMGVHQNTLGPSLGKADQAAILVPEQLRWDIREAMAGNPDIRIFADTESLIKHTMAIAREGDHILVMSNGGFDGVHERLLEALRAR
jgi:UDP-N-acetylmuramate: L-alanyl-gamma-D-glutamyl-meso-diaminopimelate ligase